MQKIIVIGSSNTDMVITTARFPEPGETILGGRFFMNSGGKGANQAVAAARLGGRVSFVTKMGLDSFGDLAFKQLKEEQIDTGFVLFDSEAPSGVALINVNERGENCIVVAPGANDNLSPADTEAALETLEENDIVLLQLEIPVGTAAYVARKASQKGAKVILNPAPAQKLPAEILKNLYLITPNETEMATLSDIQVTDIRSARKAAGKLCAAGVKNVVITMGSKGAYLYNAEYDGLIAVEKVTAVDTTAAGDCFNGALAVAISENKGLQEATAFACASASVSVSRMGAQASLPYRSEIRELMDH
jgi:ribokinase